MLFFVRALMYVCGRNERMALDLLGIKNPLWRARSICFPNLCLGSVLGYVTSPWEHFLWILFINISKKPTNYCLASVFILFFFFFFLKKFLDGFSAGNITAVGLFSRLGREGVIVPGFGQFVWVAVDFVVVVFPLHFWQSGEVAGSLFCFFDRLWIIYTGRLFWEWGFLWVLLFACRICYILGHSVLLFSFCYPEVQLALCNFQVAPVAGSFCSCFLTVWFTT